MRPAPIIAIWRGSLGSWAGGTVLELAMIVGIEIAGGDETLVSDANYESNKEGQMIW